MFLNNTIRRSTQKYRAVDRFRVILNDGFKETTEGPFYFSVNLYLFLMLWIFISHKSKQQRVLAHFAPLPAFTRFHSGKPLFNGRHSLGWAFHSNWVPFFKKIEAECPAPRKIKTLILHTEMRCVFVFCFFFSVFLFALNLFFGLQPIFSDDLSAEKVSTSIKCIGFSAKVRKQTSYETDSANYSSLYVDKSISFNLYFWQYNYFAKYAVIRVNLQHTMCRRKIKEERFRPQESKQRVKENIAFRHAIQSSNKYPKEDINEQMAPHRESTLPERNL